MMRTAIRKMGNSAGVILPKPMLRQIGAKAGDQVELSVHDGTIVVSRSARKIREGWAEAAAAIAAAGDDARVWPEFGNDDDKDWTW